MEGVGEDFDFNGPSSSPELANNTCLFFSMLPAEIRRMIYVDSLEGTYDYFGKYRPRASAAPLYVCRRMYLEASEALYSEDELFISLWDGLTALKLQSRRNAAFIRKISLGRFESGRHYPSYLRAQRSDSRPLELEQFRLRGWLQGIKKFCPKVRRISIDFSTGVMADHDGRDASGGRDAIVQVLRCVYGMADYLGFRDCLGIYVADWIFGPDPDVRGRVFTHAYTPSSQRFIYPTGNHEDCRICGGLGFDPSPAKDQNKASASSSSALPVSSYLGQLPPSVLEHIFARVVGLEVTAASTPDVFVRINDGGRASGFNTKTTWWYEKSSLRNPRNWHYEESLERCRLAFDDLLRLGETCRGLKEGVKKFFRGPCFDDAHIIFQSPTAALMFIERVRLDEGTQALGALSPVSPRTVGISLRLKHLEIPLHSKSKLVRFRGMVFPTFSGDIKNRQLRHLRLALSFLLDLEELESLTLLARPECVASLHLLGPTLLNKLTALADPDPDPHSAIDMAYELPLAPRRIPAQPRTPSVKLLLSGVKVVKLPFFQVTSYNLKVDISWLLRESIEAPFGYDGSMWRKFDGAWEVQAGAKDRSGLVLIHVVLEPNDIPAKEGGGSWSINHPGCEGSECCNYVPEPDQRLDPLRGMLVTCH